MLRLAQADIAKVDLEHLRRYVANPTEFFGRNEHYRLLAHLSVLMPLGSSVVDIGTHQGDSALALSYCSGRVDSFDVIDKTEGRPHPQNVHHHLADLFEPVTREEWRNTLLDSALILIDIDPHEGTREHEMVQWLFDNNYKGLIVLDDIWYFKPMRDNLWYGIDPRYRTDVTSLGHWSGTGIVSLGGRIELENEQDTSNWTLVTGYFDLTQKSDANDAIRARPASHYIDQHGSFVLSLDKNLIVYCDPELEEKIWSIRPAWLYSKTRVIPISFEDLPLTRHRSRIIENRDGTSGCPSDPRNTASYYLFCMARYSMVKNAIDDNPFESTHFAWINICIERMGFNNLIHLDEALGVQRNRFSTCWIDYVPKNVVEDLPQYFCGKECSGRCSMCSGFFTGRADYMRAVCDRLEEEFMRCLAAGYGHADEQLYPLVYFKNPELFDWYCGDYTEMITNYAGVYEHPERPIANLIRNSLAGWDYRVCRRACNIVLSSHDTGKCTLSADNHSMVLQVKKACDDAEPLKNLCLIFDSEPENPSHQATYDSHRYFWNRHLDNSPVEGFFIRSDPNLNVEYKIEQRTLTVKGDAGHGLRGTLHRLVRAIDILLRDHPYVVITGLASILDFRLLQNRPVQNGVYSGHVVDNEGPYVSGACALMSNDVARVVVESRSDARSQWVDVAVGEILRAKNITPQHEPMFIFDYARGFEQLESGLLRYRIKDETGDRVLERDVMRAVFEIMHPSATRVTLVTGFFRLRDRAVDEDEQFRQFDRLAMCGLPIVLFLDEQLMDRAPKQSNVQVVPTKLGDFWLFGDDSVCPKDLPKNATPGKDTRDFLLLQNSKLEMLAAANSKRQLLGSPSHFAWIDFGIMKIVRDPMVFLTRLRMLTPPSSCVLAPGCWDRARSDQSDSESVNWRFCGGFLLADCDSIPGLVTAHRAAFVAQERLTWEVNIWAAMERAGQKFDWYQADHDDSIIAWSPPVVANSGTRICLNMIVKNEAKIIERCLTSVLPFIDMWCIVDTGSTDDTVSVIKRFFATRSVPGKIVHGTFKNYAQARNDALQAARAVPGWDYALLIDADMTAKGSLNKAELKASAYLVVQYASDLDYPNTRLVRRDAPAKYLSVTHEYLSVEGVEHLDTLSMDDHADGGNRPEKGERDIRLLNEGLVDEPDNGRYMFYLAQTYRGMGRQQEAIQWYTRRITLGGWDEETWASYYGIAHSYKELGETANFIKACLEAYNYRPSRGESLKLLAQYYREKGQNESALVIASALATIEYPHRSLFVERNVYDFGTDQEISIAGYWSKIPRWREAGYRACMDLTIHPNGEIRNEARKNATHYLKSAHEIFGAEVREIEWKPENGWAPMNPSVCVRGARRLVLVRTVNYKVTREGQYPTVDNSGIIRTRNHVLEMDHDWRPIKSTLITDAIDIPRTNFPVEGYEDCRLWGGGKKGCFCVSATVRDLTGNQDGRCEMAIMLLDEQWRVVDVRAIHDYESDKTQKNWMPIVGQMGRFLYFCDPAVVIDASNEKTIELSKSKAPLHLGELRGGSQLIPHRDGWLCLVHEVVWRPERVYMHRFVWLTKTFHVEALSDPFYFSRVGIEFCAGLARDGDRLVASFGVNDESAHLAFFRPDAVDRMLGNLA